MRFTDEILPVVPGRSARASLRVDPDAAYFDDHFPGNPMLPGLVMLEAAVRTASAIWPEDTSPDRHTPTLDGVERFQVTRRVLPGETLVVMAEAVDGSGDQTTQTFRAMGVVTGQTAMRATFRLRSLDAASETKRR